MTHYSCFVSMCGVVYYTHIIYTHTKKKRNGNYTECSQGDYTHRKAKSDTVLYSTEATYPLDRCDNVMILWILTIVPVDLSCFF